MIETRPNHHIHSNERTSSHSRRRDKSPQPARDRGKAAVPRHTAETTTNPLTKDQITEKLLQLVGVANMLALADEASAGRIDPAAVGSTGKLLASLGMEVLHALDQLDSNPIAPL